MLARLSRRKAIKKVRNYGKIVFIKSIVEKWLVGRVLPVPPPVEITPKRVMSGGIHLRGLAPGQYCKEAAVATTASDLTGPGIDSPDFPHRQ